jgi:hypothetical protein
MNTGNVAFVGELTEADTAEFEITNVPALTATAPATSNESGRVLRSALGLCDLSGSSHRLVRAKRETEVSK